MGKIKTSPLHDLTQGFKQFYQFSPEKLILILVLMIIQGLTASVGLLFIIPLLQIVGFDTGISNIDGIADTANQFFHFFNLETNLPNILFCYIFIVTTIATLRYQLTVTMSSIQQNYICFLRNQLYSNLLKSNWSFIIQNKMSDFTHSLTGQIQSIGHASHLMLNFLSQIILSFLMVTLALLISWKLTALAVLFGSILLAILLPLNKIIYGSGHTQLINFKSIFQILTEHLSNLKMIKSYASENFHANKMQKVSEKLEAQQIKLTKMNAMTSWFYMIAAVVSFSVFFYVSQTILFIPLASTLLLLILFSRLLPQLSNLQRNYQQLLHKAPAFNDINHMMKKCLDAAESDINTTATPQLNDSIQLKNIAFRYENKHTFVFEKINLTITKNQTIALVGSSGSGKSTLADLIAGLLKPTQGEIFCDDILLDDLTRISWRKQVAYVTQEVYLFHDTIRENLSWVSKDKVSDQTLWEVLKLAAADFVKTLPEGLDTIIGDRGIRLSGGERQRLALARALLTKPKLLILDEATSALDRKNEEKIQQALKQLKGNLTILIIAHSETTIKEVDQRIILENKNTSTSTQSLAKVEAEI